MWRAMRGTRRAGSWRGALAALAGGIRDVRGIREDAIGRGVLLTAAVAMLAAGLGPGSLAAEEVDEWIRQFGTSSTDVATGISADASGVYVAGWTFGALPGQISAGDVDAFVRKYDPDGNEVWTRQFGTSGPDVAEAVSVDVSGIYVAGRTWGVLPGQSTLSDFFSDAFVRKYDHDGNEIWTRQFGTSSNDLATGISVDASGVYVAGWTEGTLPAQTTLSSFRDAFVRKYDHDGNEIWTRQFGTSRNDQAQAISVDASGVYVAGRTFGVLPGQTTLSDFFSDAFVRKYDPDGNEVWTRQFGTSRSDEAQAVSVDAFGVYVAGFTVGALPGQSSTSSEFTSDAFVRRYDPDGNEVWTRQFGTSGPDSAHAISVDASGIYVAGRTAGTLPGQASTSSGFTPDAFVRRYDPDGNEVWTRQFGTLSNDLATGISVDASGVYLAGWTLGTLPGQSSAGEEQDAFVVKFPLELELIQPPVADAGPDQIVPCASVDATLVFLDGSGSFDPDGAELTYTWTGPFPEGDGTTDGVTAWVTLPLGTSTLTLVVNNGRLDSAPDTVDQTVAVTVVGLQPPLGALVPEGESVPLPDRAFRQRQTLPLRLELFCGGTGLTDADVAAPRIVSLLRTGDEVELVVTDEESTESEDSGWVFRSAGGLWTYNLGTRDLETGTYVVTIEMPDGLRYTAGFVLR